MLLVQPPEGGPVTVDDLTDGLKKLGMPSAEITFQTESGIFYTAETMTSWPQVNVVVIQLIEKEF